MAAAAAEDKVVLSVEVCVRQDSRADLGTVKAAALAYLLTLPSVRYAEALLAPPPGQHPLLDAHVQSMRICDIGDQLPHGKLLLQWDVAWTVSGSKCGTQPCRSCDDVQLRFSRACQPLLAASLHPPQHLPSEP